ncbi:rod shape-determining protein MreD [uncultured Jannaschia sp.]|uniref:rod shape-determining protein MreD n=1 Tax=uncultured Jannaschia sp. TaxID=293347 RepID=UPI0026254451|nr:rod shape-determining protein MreD [uncultured Jannaschia sp.]
MATRSVWAFRLLFVALSAGILFFALVPFGVGERAWPGPELMVCLTVAWVLRRPDYVPVWLLLPLLLLDDALLLRPLGLWTLLVFLLSEYLRRRVDHAEALPFLSELFLVAGGIVAVFVANHVALVLLLVETPPAHGQALHALATIAFYPVVALGSQLLGVRRLAPGELDSLGSRA